MCDFDRIRHEVRPADVILVEGRSHVSDVIKNVTQSPWSHAALCVGRLHDIESPALREKVRNNYQGDTSAQLIIEALMDRGMVISPLDLYSEDHLRICRPKGLSHGDGQRVIGFALRQLGTDYDIRQILDLLRFLFPYALLPRRWRSSLFNHKAGGPTRTVCSSMIAEAYTHVHFPVRPWVTRSKGGRARFYKRNPRLYTPMDFDYSPYFDIIKYPFWGYEDTAQYHGMNWHGGDALWNDEDEYMEQELRDK